MDKKFESWEEFYKSRSAQIYELRYSKDIQKEEKDKRIIQDELLEFLKLKLTQEEYQTAWNYINNFSEKTNSIIGLWNKKFYFSALKDAKKYGGIKDE